MTAIRQTVSVNGNSFPDPLVFVGGAQRSGTTLLRNMLTAHPALAIPDENWFVYRVWHDLRARGRPDDVELAWRLIRATPGFQRWRLPPDEIEALLGQAPPRSYPELIRAVFTAYARSRGKPRAGDKTTRNALDFLELSQLFHTSRFIHVLRDPRESCMSLAVQSFNRGGIAGAARHWRVHVSSARAASAPLGRRWLEVRYEHLIERPREQLERICRFLELPFDAAMLRYPDSPDVLPRHEQDVLPREPLHPRLRAWEEELTLDEVAVIEFITGRLMDQVGYPRRVKRLTPKAAAAILGERSERARERWLQTGAPALGVALRVALRR